LSYIEIHDENGVRTIDMEPVDALLALFDSSYTSQQAGRLKLPVDFHERVKSLSHEQTRYLVSGIAAAAVDAINLLNEGFRGGFRDVLETIDMFKEVGTEQEQVLWPDLGD